MELEKFKLGATPLKESAFKKGKVLTVSRKPKLQYAWDNGPAIGRYLAEMKEGRIPLHTFRANIDYGFAESQTTFGTIGVKVWIFNGEVFGRDATKDDAGLLVSKQGRERTGSRR